MNASCPESKPEGPSDCVCCSQKQLTLCVGNDVVEGLQHHALDAVDVGQLGKVVFQGSGASRHDTPLRLLRVCQAPGCCRSPP
jgi:hypothetical protein